MKKIPKAIFYLLKGECNDVLRPNMTEADQLAVSDSFEGLEGQVLAH